MEIGIAEERDRKAREGGRESRWRERGKRIMKKQNKIIPICFNRLIII